MEDLECTQPLVEAVTDIVSETATNTTEEFTEVTAAAADDDLTKQSLSMRMFVFYKI